MKKAKEASFIINNDDEDEISYSRIYQDIINADDGDYEISQDDM